MPTFVVRLWLPDRPGALGQVASRIGAVRGEIVGIEILERGAGRAVDELVVELPDGALTELLVHEVQEVDGVDVEEVRVLVDGLHDPRLEALEAVAVLVGASERDELVEAIVGHAKRVIGAEWAAVVALDDGWVLAREGPVPPGSWLLAYVTGGQESVRAGGDGGADDVVWSPLPSAELAVVLGRERTPFRARERRQLAALARVVDTRLHEVSALRGRAAHPSGS